MDIACNHCEKPADLVIDDGTTRIGTCLSNAGVALDALVLEGFQVTVTRAEVLASA